MFPFDFPENIRKPKVFFLCLQEDQKETLKRKRVNGQLVRKSDDYKNEYLNLGFSVGNNEGS